MLSSKRRKAVAAVTAPLVRGAEPKRNSDFLKGGSL
jgi:hypothetical protein